MTRGPRPGGHTTFDHIAKARAAWGDDAPYWVLALADYAKRTSGRIASETIGYSAAVVSNVIANKYSGDMSRVEQKVRGALMNEKVMCPILGEIGRDHCLDEQKMPFSAASSIRSRLFHACRSGCGHSRIVKPGDAA